MSKEKTSIIVLGHPLQQLIVAIAIGLALILIAILEERPLI